MAIIKCPECNHEVSSLAPTCPTCGVEIANNLTECPDCGKTLLKGTPECPNCHCDMHVQTPVTKKNNYREYPEKEYTPPRSYKTLWTILATLALIVLIISGGLFWYTYKENQKQVKLSYQKIKETSDIELCEKFIKDYPKSKYTAEVTELLAKFKDIRNEWLKIDSSVKKEDYMHFMEQYSNSYYRKDCLSRIDSLDWAQTVMTNTPESYQNYLTNHTQGKYSDKAKNGNTFKTDTISYQEKYRIATNIKLIHSAISFNKIDSLSYFTTPDMKRQITELADKLHKENKYVLFYINSSIHVSKVPGINEPYLFRVTYRYTQYLISNAGEVIKKPYDATTLFTPGMKMTALNSTEVSYVYIEEE